MTAEARMLWGLAGFFLLLGLVYGATSHEAAGTVLLLLCSVAAVVSVLPLRRRRPAATTDDAQHVEVGTSLWPFVMGAGAVLMVDGLVLGPWLFVPGAALALRGLVGVLSRRSPATGEPDRPEERSPTS